MYTILLPIDFSECALHSLEYAKLISKSFQVKLKLLHVNVLMTDTAGIPAEHALQKDLKQELVSTQRMTEVEKELKNEDLDVETITCRGIFVGDEITRISQEIQANLIILGARHDHNFIDKLLGSNASYVIKHAKSPVLVVPLEAKIKPIKRILMGSQLQVNELQYIKLSEQLAKELKAEFKLLTINLKKQEEHVRIRKKIETFTGEKYTFDIYEAKTINEGLIQYSLKEAPDIFVMVTHKQNILEKMFNPSHTISIAKKIKIPLLAYHH